MGVARHSVAVYAASFHELKNSILLSDVSADTYVERKREEHWVEDGYAQADVPGVSRTF